LAHRDDFTMVLIERPEEIAACDVCTQFCAIGWPRIRTFIGDTAQSDLCLDCAHATTKIFNDMRRASRIPAETKLRVKAEPELETAAVV